MFLVTYQGYSTTRDQHMKKLLNLDLFYDEEALKGQKTWEPSFMFIGLASGDEKFFFFYLLLRDLMTKGTCELLSGSTSTYVNTLPILIIISLAEEEI